MTTETTCLSSIWRTDDKIEESSMRSTAEIEDYKELNPGPTANYDGMLVVELDKIRPDDRDAIPPKQHIYDR